MTTTVTVVAHNHLATVTVTDRYGDANMKTFSRLVVKLRDGQKYETSVSGTRIVKVEEDKTD